MSAQLKLLQRICQRDVQIKDGQSSYFCHCYMLIMTETWKSEPLDSAQEAFLMHSLVQRSKMVQVLWLKILQECTYAFTAAYTGSLASATQWESRKTQQEMIPSVLSLALACYEKHTHTWLPSMLCEGSRAVCGCVLRSEAWWQQSGT